MKQNVVKRLLAVAVALMMIVVAVPMTVAAADVAVPSTSWQGSGNYDISWYNNTDTSFEIDTAAELAGLSYLTLSNKFEGKTIYITKDIDLGAHEWKGLGKNDNHPDGFRGSVIGKKDGVEGAAVTISNMMNNDSDFCRGFIRVHTQGAVANLIFDNAYIESIGYAGIVSGWTRFKDGNLKSITYENITVKNSKLVVNRPKTAGDNNYCGIVVGLLNTMGSQNVVNMTNCAIFNSSVVDKVANGNITCFGGFVGSDNWGAIAFDGCTVADLSISTQGTGTYNAMGDYVGHRAADTSVTMTNCTIEAQEVYNSKVMGTGDVYDITAPTMLDGASMRTTEGENGLRFTSVMSKENIDKLGETYSFGTLVSFASELTEGVNFTVEGLNATGKTKYTTIKAVNGIYENYDGADGVKFNAALIGITDKAAEYAARSYVDVTANGLTIRVYSAFDAAKNERSMEYVANRALNDVKDAQEEAIANGFAYRFEVSEYNSDATGATCTMTAGTKYSCYAPAEWEVLKNWSSAS